MRWRLEVILRPSLRPWRRPWTRWKNTSMMWMSCRRGAVAILLTESTTWVHVSLVICHLRGLNLDVMYLHAFCHIKNTQKSISAGALPCTPLGYLTPLPRPPSWWKGALSPRTLPRLGPSGLELRPFGPRCSVPPYFSLHSAAPANKCALLRLAITAV